MSGSEFGADPDPSVIISVFAGSVTGYALSHWRVRGAHIIMLFLLLGAFIPYQVILYPLVKIFSNDQASTALPALYHRSACAVRTAGDVAAV